MPRRLRQPDGCGNAATVQANINANVHRTDLGIRRDTVSVDYRYTPTDAWDFRPNYDHMRRTGTQIDGVVFSPGTSGVVSQVPKPVADTTQNFGLSGEYAGTSFWGQKFNLKVAYSGSQFQDDFDSYTVENPFCATASGTHRRRRVCPNRLAIQSVGSHVAVARQPGPRLHRHARRGSALQEPLHGHDLLHHDAAEPGVPAVHRHVPSLYGWKHHAGCPPASFQPRA